MECREKGALGEEGDEGDGIGEAASSETHMITMYIGKVTYLVLRSMEASVHIEDGIRQSWEAH